MEPQCQTGTKWCLFPHVTILSVPIPHNALCLPPKFGGGGANKVYHGELEKRELKKVSVKSLIIESRAEHELLASFMT